MIYMEDLDKGDEYFRLSILIFGDRALCLA